jgi:phenylacetate-CoA ligase
MRGTDILLTSLAQLRFAAALGFGRPIPGWALDRIIDAALASRREFGPIGADGSEAIAGSALDEATQREVQLRSFRAQARRAARETSYYAPLFAGRGLDPGKLTWDDVVNLPVTPKEALRGDPDAFVRQGATPVLRTTTTGTTGRPTQVCFSARELRTIGGLAALGYVIGDELASDDVVQVNTSSRASLGNLALALGCARVGALVQPVGLIDPALSLALPSERHRVAGKKSRVSFLSVYPSYLGELVETGLHRGYGPVDFGLETIAVGGEVVTAGLKERVRALFGDVRFVEGYAMTETFPFGGTRCEQGHLHFEPAHGLLEVVDPDSGRTCEPGQAGTIVATPFPPFRETTLLLRYDTEDVVRPLPGPLTCTLRQRPATTDLLGKLRLSVRHDTGWSYPRQILEALEIVASVPLPARCGFWAVPGGVAVEVVVRDTSPGVRRAIENRLADQGVPMRDLRLLTDRAELRHPLPHRGDLREELFATARPPISPNGAMREADRLQRLIGTGV